MSLCSTLKSTVRWWRFNWWLRGVTKGWESKRVNYTDSVHCTHISTEPRVTQCSSVTSSTKNQILDTLWMKNCDHRRAFHSQEFIISSSQICIELNPIAVKRCAVGAWLLHIVVYFYVQQTSMFSKTGCMASISCALLTIELFTQDAFKGAPKHEHEQCLLHMQIDIFLFCILLTNIQILKFNKTDNKKN